MADNKDMKVSQVAKLLNTSPKKVYYMIETGALKSYKLGKKSFRITEKELNRVRGI